MIEFATHQWIQAAMVLATVLGSSSLYSQEPSTPESSVQLPASLQETPTANDATPAEAQTPAIEPVTSDSIGGMIVSGGTLNILFFLILGVFSLWAATVIFERIVNLRRDKLLPTNFEKQFLQIVQNPQATPAKMNRLCETNDVASSRILQAGLIRAGRPVPEVEKSMEDAAAREMALLRGKSRPLGVVGSVAPLVGLLGTVVGMIMAFQISSQEGLGKAERLAEGIYLALMTTAAGLTIAIPCLLFASWFQARAERYMCDISDCLTKSLPSFARMEGKSELPIDGHAREEDPDDLSARERFLREGMTGSANR